MLYSKIVIIPGMRPSLPLEGKGTAVAVDEVECPSAEPCAMTSERNDEGIVPYM